MRRLSVPGITKHSRQITDEALSRRSLAAGGGEASEAWLTRWPKQSYSLASTRRRYPCVRDGLPRSRMLIAPFHVSVIPLYIVSLTIKRCAYFLWHLKPTNQIPGTTAVRFRCLSLRQRYTIHDTVIRSEDTPQCSNEKRKT